MRPVAGENVLLTLLVGGLWAIGYVAVPVIFATLEDKQLAGQLAARLFSVGGGMAMVMGGLLLLLLLLKQGRALFADWSAGALLLLLLLLAVVQFAIAPEINVMREAGNTAAADFKSLHQWASGLYMAASVLGLALVAFRQQWPSAKP